MGSDEIRRQLPSEAQMFQHVNKDWTGVMSEWNGIRIAKTCCLIPGQFQRFLGMQEYLEKIQRSLNDYLETKRMAFPRFYFLSDDDLLEILGHAKQPNKIQKHMKKLFAGVSHLILKAPRNSSGSGGQITAAMVGAGADSWQALGMVDPKSEELTFVTPVIIKGAVEGWLATIEDTMRVSLQKCLQTTLLAIANPKRKKENWIRSSVGQLLILSGQISWTSECVKGLSELNKNKNALKKLKKSWKKYLDLCA
jgi:dynein heavy chain